MFIVSSPSSDRPVGGRRAEKLALQARGKGALKHSVGWGQMAYWR